ncbi:MAG: methyltransferase domain-containing protein [Alphaproteobacteria bacterium]
MPKPIPEDERRTPERLRAHYRIERDLATALKTAPREERKRLYSSLYDELYRRVPDHPQLVRKKDAAAQRATVARQMRFLGRFLSPDSTFMELGPGDCALSHEVARHVKGVVAVDVSEEIARTTASPANFRLALSDGVTVPVPGESVSVAYSNQLIEHLHPDDARAQMENVFAALKKDGRYVCITPNRLTGPHDVSAYFEDTAAGFHLKEYTNAELARLMTAVGFRRIEAFAVLKGVFFRVPLWLLRGAEALLARLPFPLRRLLVRWRPVEALLGVQLVALK